MCGRSLCLFDLLSSSKEEAPDRLIRLPRCRAAGAEGGVRLKGSQHSNIKTWSQIITVLIKLLNVVNIGCYSLSIPFSIVVGLFSPLQFILLSIFSSVFL